MARLFTAIELTPPVRAAVTTVQQDLARAVSAPHARLRLVRPAELHLTMAFLGDVQDGRVAAVADAIARGFELAPFTLAFAGCGIFPPRGRARVLWLGVSEETGALNRLYQHLVDRLRGAEVRIDGDRWTPHLTLGRWRDDGPRAPRLPAVGTVATQVVSDVVLVHSQLRPDGPTHTVIARGLLSPTSAPLH